MISKRLLTILIVLSTLSILLCGLVIVGTMVSLKYETSTNDCVSAVTGIDLCQALWLWRAGAVVAGLITVGLVGFGHRLTRPRQ